jgi:hypothetical protein
MNCPVERPHPNTLTAWEKLDDRARKSCIGIAPKMGSADLGLLIRQLAATYAVRNPR